MRRRRVAVVAVVGGLVAAVGLLAAAGATLLGPRTPTVAGEAPAFVDETATSGLAARFDGPELYQVGGGLAVFDCDGDRRPDIYHAGGEGPAALFRNESSIGGRLRFERVPSPTTDVTSVNGAYPIDVDGDGATDLVVLRVGESLLLRGRGDCSFELANEALGFDGINGHATAFSATWEEPESLPTLAMGRYLTLGPDGDTTFDCADNVLLRPDPDAPRFGRPIPLLPGYCALSMLFSDWDRSGRRDLRVSNDRQYYRDGMEQLWRLEPGAAPRLYTADEGWASLQIWGMGIASQDLTGDGLPEVYLTSQADNKLQTLAAGPGQPRYRDIALRRGVTSAQPFDENQHLPSTAWHPEFADVNNDGFTDLFVSKGNVGAQQGYATRDPSDLFLGQPDGAFVQAADRAGIVRYDRGRGAALADFNLDGLLDLVTVSYRADTVLWRNVGSGTADAPSAMGHWLLLDLEQPGANRRAIGAILEVRIGDLLLTRERVVGGGHVSGQLGWIHLGLGPAKEAQVRVTWPDGTVGSWLTVPADGFSIIERGASAATPWVPDGPR